MQNNKFKSKLYEKILRIKSDSRSHKDCYLKEDSLYKCLTCEFITMTKLDIRRHIQIHSENTLNQCTYCFKTFKRGYDLKDHVKVAHTKEGSYECQVCKFSTRRRSSLYSHMKSHDEAFIECICPICGSKFKSKAIFKYHLLSHADAKSFCCKVCGKTFTIASRLRRHEMHVHGPKNFKCSICHKAFPTVHHLNRHNLIHSGEKPFSCTICSYSSSTQGNVVKHIKLIHGKIGDSNKYILKKRGDSGLKIEKIKDQEEIDYLKAKGKDIAIKFLDVLNTKGLSNITLDQLNEKKKNREQKKMTKWQKKLEKLVKGRKNNCKKNCDINTDKKEVNEQKINIELQEAIVNDDFFIQHVEEVVENDCAVISPPTQSEYVTLNKSEIASQPKLSVKERLKNIKEIKHYATTNDCRQFIVNENDLLNHTFVDIEGKGSKLHSQNSLQSPETLEEFDNFEYSNIVYISQEELDRNDKCIKLLQENEKKNLSCKKLLQNNQKLLKDKVYIVSKDKISSEILESNKGRKINNSSNCKINKQNSSKLMNGLKTPIINNDTFIKHKNLCVNNHNHILSPILVNNINNDRKNLETNLEYNKAISNNENFTLVSKLDHGCYNFKILQSPCENVSMTESADMDLTVNQTNVNSKNCVQCVVLDARKYKYFNSKNINLYIAESSDFMSEDYIFQPEKEFRIPKVSMTYDYQVDESTMSLSEKSNEENELCYHLLNLGSENVLKLSQERTPSKLQINIHAGDNISTPYVLQGHADTDKDFEKITIHDTFYQAQCSNEDVNLESIAEVEETSNSEVTLHIVNDY